MKETKIDRRMKDLHKGCRIVSGHHFDVDDVCKKCGKREVDLIIEPAYYGFDNDAVEWILRGCPTI